MHNSNLPRTQTGVVAHLRDIIVTTIVLLESGLPGHVLSFNSLSDCANPCNIDFELSFSDSCLGRACPYGPTVRWTRSIDQPERTRSERVWQLLTRGRDHERALMWNVLWSQADRLINIDSFWTMPCCDMRAAFYWPRPGQIMPGHSRTADQVKFTAICVF